MCGYVIWWLPACISWDDVNRELEVSWLWVDDSWADVAEKEKGASTTAGHGFVDIAVAMAETGGSSVGRMVLL
jgi:hypothetical protein